jgi:hypothetical protein
MIPKRMTGNKVHPTFQPALSQLSYKVVPE